MSEIKHISLNGTTYDIKSDATWGGISGDITEQEDLQTTLESKIGKSEYTADKNSYNESIAKKLEYNEHVSSTEDLPFVFNLDIWGGEGEDHVLTIDWLKDNLTELHGYSNDTLHRSYRFHRITWIDNWQKNLPEGYEDCVYYKGLMNISRSNVLFYSVGDWSKSNSSGMNVYLVKVHSSDNNDYILPIFSFAKSTSRNPHILYLTSQLEDQKWRVVYSNGTTEELDSTNRFYETTSYAGIIYPLIEDMTSANKAYWNFLNSNDFSLNGSAFTSNFPNAYMYFKNYDSLSSTYKNAIAADYTLTDYYNYLDLPEYTVEYEGETFDMMIDGSISNAAIAKTDASEIMDIGFANPLVNKHDFFTVGTSNEIYFLNDDYQYEQWAQPTEYILYDNASSSIVTGNIALNDDVTNYKYLEIYYKENNGIFGYIKLDVVDNKYFYVSVNYIENNNVYIKSKLMQISGTNIVNTSTYRTVVITSTGAVSSNDGNTIRITKVVGHK